MPGNGMLLAGFVFAWSVHPALDSARQRVVRSGRARFAVPRPAQAPDEPAARSGAHGRVPAPRARRRDRVSCPAHSAEGKVKHRPRLTRFLSPRAAPAVQACPDERRLEAESLTDGLEIERPIGGGRLEPRVRIEEEPPSTPAQRRCVLLEVTDRTFQHGEHQALLWSEHGPDTAENLRGEDRIHRRSV